MLLTKSQFKTVAATMIALAAVTNFRALAPVKKIVLG